MKILAVTLCFALQMVAVLSLAEEVYLIRGAGNVFSTGMDQLNNKLLAKGIEVSVHSNGEWSSLANDIIRRAKKKQIDYPIIISGHSYGGVEASKFANLLGSKGIPVAMIIGLDPGFPQTEPLGSGIRRVINYKLPSGQDYIPGKNFTGTIRTVDLTPYKVTHTSLDDSEVVHQLVIKNIISEL